MKAEGAGKQEDQKVEVGWKREGGQARRERCERRDGGGGRRMKKGLRKRRRKMV